MNKVNYQKIMDCVEKISSYALSEGYELGKTDCATEKSIDFGALKNCYLNELHNILNKID